MSTVPPPYDDLQIDPYSLYPTADLTKCRFPEISTKGVGLRGIFPFFSIVIELWHAATEGDYLGFRLDDLSLPITSTNITTIQSRYILNVDASKIRDGDLPFFARVYRIASNHESRSATQTMLFKQTTPGGEDRRIWEPWHSGYLMWLRDMAEGAILNASTIAGGLWVVIDPYLYIRQNDVIMIYVDGILFEYVVSPSEAAALKPLEILIPEAILQQITPFGPVGIVFTVRDVVGNTPQGKYWLSKVIMLNSELKPGLLDNPVFTIDGNEASQVDLDVLGTSKCEVLVTLPRKTPAPSPRNKVVVILAITLADGTTRTERLSAVPDRNLRGEAVPVDTNLLKDLSGGWLRISFEWQTDPGVVLGTSTSYLVMVFGTPTRMPALTLVPMQAGLIAPKTDVQAILPLYTPHDPKNLETVILEPIMSDGSGERVTYLQLAGPQGGARHLSQASLAVLEGKGACQAYYETDDGKGTPASKRQSDPLGFEIGVRTPVLPPMEIEHAKFGNIYLPDVTGPETQMFVTHASTVAGEKVHVSVVGKDASSSFSVIIDVTKATEGATLTTLGIPLPKTLLIDNDGGSIRASYTVETQGSPPTYQASKVLDITIGEPVKTGSLVIVEADATNATIAPSAVLKGATLKIPFSPAGKDYVLFWSWDGQYDISAIKGEVKVGPTDTSITVPIPRSIIALGLRPTGNSITVKCKLMRGQFSYLFDDLTLFLQPLKALPSIGIVGYENVTALQVSLLPASVTIRVVPWHFIDVDQPMWLNLKGVRADGSVYNREILNATKVTSAQVTGGVTVSVPLAEFSQLKDGSSFEIDFLVSLPKIASKQTATQFPVKNYVIQQLPATLSFPTFVGAAATQTVTIDPLSFQTNTSVTANYTGILTTDVITMICTNQSGTQISLALNGKPGGVVFNFTPHQVLHNSVSGWMQFRYSITRNGKVTPSHVLTVYVSAIAPGNMPRPTINGLAHGALLNVNSFSGDAYLTLLKWPLSKTGQRVTISLLCAGFSLTLRNVHPASAAEAASGLVNIPISRNWLLGLPHNNWLSITGYITYSGIGGGPGGVSFQTTTYLMHTKLNPPVIRHVLVAKTGRSIPNGGTVNYAAEGYGTQFYIDVDLRPYTRSILLTNFGKGGYLWTVPAGVTQTQTWAGFWPLGVTDVYVEEQSDKSVKSAVFWWNKI